ncbi:MAG: tetratricopeptide repeat protein [Candidatus Coatesbacteria bacterium]|nr:MAG: tetratricopeptide repeat protein [Candidatus Coatesbacteria bacterium]
MKPRYPELKSVAVLFADIKGFTGLAEELEPDRTADVINRCFLILDGAVYRYGGNVNKHLGDGIMALFGAPVADERAAERAVLAGLAMQERIKSLSRALTGLIGGPLPLKVGIDLGTVYFGEVGSTGDVSVIGDVVNRAERIEEICPPGDVLVNGPVKDAAAPFAYEPAGEVRLRGRKEVSNIWRVAGILDSNVRWETLGASELVGRDEEFGKVAAYIERALTGDRVIVGVVGATGCGKSTAAAQAVRRAELAGMRAFLCECNPYTEFVPYHPLRTAFAKALGVKLPPEREEIHDKAKELFPELPPAGDWLATLFLADGQVFSVVVDAEKHEREDQVYNVREMGAKLLEKNAAEGLLLVVDDFDWSDRATIDFLSHVKAGGNGGVCVFLTAGSRDALNEIECDEIIEFGPLGESALRGIIHESHPAMDNEAVTEIVTRAAGNPLFAVELARSVSRGESVSETIKMVVQVRLDRLEPEAKRFLKAVAILGPDVKKELLRNVLNLTDDVPTIIDELAGGNFIRLKDGLVSFNNELVREVTYATIVREEKELTADRALAFLDEFYEPESLDWLIRRAAWSDLAGNRAEAGECYARLGTLASESFSFDEAERYFGQAIDRFGDEPEFRPIRFTTQVERSKNLVAADEYEKARVLLENEFREDDPADLKAAVVMGIGRCYYREGQYKEALVYYEDADHLLREFEDSEAKAELAHLRAVSLYHLGRFAGALGNAEMALGTYRTLADKDNEAAALNVLGIIDRMLRRNESAVKHFNAALNLWRETDNRLGIAKSTLNLGGLYTNPGIKDFAKAEELLKESTSIAEEIGARRTIARAEANLADVCARLARFKEAEERAGRALELAREINDVDLESAVLAMLASAATDNKEYEKAWEYCALAYELAVRTSGRIRLQKALDYWASLLADDPEASDEEFREKADELKEIAYIPEYKERADTLMIDRALATGRHRDALELIEGVRQKYAAPTESTRLFLEFHKGVALLELGELGGAEECLLARYRASSEPELPKLLAAYYLARLYYLKKEYDKASRYLDEAGKAFDDGGVTYWSAACKRLAVKLLKTGEQKAG